MIISRQTFLMSPVIISKSSGEMKEIMTFLPDIITNVPFVIRGERDDAVKTSLSDVIMGDRSDDDIKISLPGVIMADRSDDDIGFNRHSGPPRFGVEMMI